MSAPVSLWWSKPPALFSYGAAILSVAAAQFIAQWLQIHYGFEPLGPFLCAMMFSAWFGGVKPGLFAVALCLLAFHYYFLVPIYPSDMENEIPRLLVAALTSLFIVLLSAAQRGATQARRESEQRFLSLFQNSKNAGDHLRLVVDTIPMMVWSLRPDGRLESINRRWLEYTGLTLREALEDSTRTVHPQDLKRVLEKWIADMAAGRPSEDELRLRRADGEYRWFLIRTVPLRDAAGNIVKWYGTSTDIEDRKRAEEALRALSRRLVDLQESERRDLSRELHDRVGQNLTALKINLDILGSAFPLHGNADVHARLDDSAALLRSTIETIGNVMSELRPPMLDDHGLAAALDWHARRFSARTGIAVAVRGTDPPRRPPPQVEIALFRIAQEALNNVAKHAHARHVEIALDHAGGEYVMSVRDDGIGFDSEVNTPGNLNPGLGVVTMRERSQAIGGRFEVRTLPERGTQLTARIPY